MYDMLDIFNSDPFSVISLTEAMREVKYIPGRIGKLGLFETGSTDKLTIAIEKDAEQNVLIIPFSPRGSAGVTWGKNRRSMRTLTIPHLQVDDAIYADEVQGVRAFGEQYAVETLARKIATRGAEASQFFALTEEYHRLELIKTGNFLDKDGSVIFNYFTEFGEAQPAAIDFDLDNANPADGVLREKCAEVYEKMGETLDGLPFTGIRALCGAAFFKALIKHKEVRETYKGYAAAATLRQGFVNNGAASGQSGILSTFDFGDITWEWYRGGQTVGIQTDSVHIIPEGVPGLFKTIYGPADYIETVNTEGQRLYAKQWRMQNDKGINLEYQSNPLHFCNRPRVLFRGTRT